jgi:hypothetical protein
MAIGLSLCALGLWSGLVYAHNQAVFSAQAVQASAVIDQIYTSAPSQGYNPPTFDEYALVHFGANGTIAHARVLLATNCSGTCVPVYRVGQVLTVDYSRENLSYAQLHSRTRKPSANFVYALLLFGSFGVIFLGAAVINMVTR